MIHVLSLACLQGNATAPAVPAREAREVVDYRHERTSLREQGRIGFNSITASGHVIFTTTLSCAGRVDIDNR